MPTSLRVKYNQKLVHAFVDSGSAISVASYDLLNNQIILIIPMCAANNIIDTNNACPLNQNSRRLSIHKSDNLNKLVDSLLRSGVIRRLQSSKSSPIVLIQQKSGGLRLCVD
ncbi:hypothetical protein RF11_16327 [Thelohanellus kitauei]|uniref:Uncharacterized protein n=1 Tax=Thelohanellus kitauei TaxID=669202 RepID=A0A0C2MVJ4_THEKT|nr:hypothetical protein RF11_16327 [Thelohanellus kitauei]